MKQLPNIFTLLNLVFGCLAIVSVLQTGLSISSDETGQNLFFLPEKIYWASIFIGCAAVIDFFDGFLARLLKVPSEMGKQLDSLADVVSFGVAPGMIVYQFLMMSYAQQPDGLNTNALFLLPAFIIPCAGAYRLARFNLDTTQQYGFKGVPIPAAGLLIASFPLIYWYSNYGWTLQWLLNPWFWYAVVIAVSYLMVCSLPMLSLKFKNFNLQDNWAIFLLLILILVAAFIFHWLAVPVAFILYVTLSLISGNKKKPKSVEL